MQPILPMSIFKLHSFMKLSYLLFSVLVVAGLSSCNKERILPATATEFSGVVTDEDGRALPNVEISFGGTKKHSFLSYLPTFTLITLTDSLGQYHVSARIPNETSLVYLGLNSNRLEYPYMYHVEINGVYEPYFWGGGISVENQYFKIGQSKVLNFKRVRL